jgi:PIN domain nuclease of toxin-antitoxin system
MKLGLSLKNIISEQQKRNGLIVVPVTLEHVLSLQSLPHHHKDPFDRLLIAQALTENAVVVSKDKSFSPYPVTILW